MFKIIKRYYDKGFYSKEDVKVFVKASQITEEEYQEISGKPTVNKKGFRGAFAPTIFIFLPHPGFL